MLYQTNEVDERTLQKCKETADKMGMSSWLYAFLLDSNEEEREGGRTIEVGRAHFNSPKKRFTILDCPGHKDYVPNMIGGASQADIAILVISARTGEFETGFKNGGQTQEHAMLVKTLGISKLIVVVNKMDECGWAKSRFDEIQQELLPFLVRPSKNYKSTTKITHSLEYKESDLIWIPLSDFAGINITQRMDKSVCDWYDGPCLLEALDNLPPMNRNNNGPVRIPLLGSYKEAGSTYLLGKIESGEVNVNDRLVLMPNQQSLSVSFIELDTGESVPTAKAGENVRIGTKDVSTKQVNPGFMLCSVGDLAHVTKKITAQISILDLPNGGLFTVGFSAMFQIHNALEECTVDAILGTLDRKSKKFVKSKPFCKVGDIVQCSISLENSVCLDLFNSLPAIGRFTLRVGTVSVAFGKVTAFN